MVKLSVVAVNKYKLTSINVTIIVYIFLLYRWNLFYRIYNFNFFNKVLFTLTHYNYILLFIIRCFPNTYSTICLRLYLKICVIKFWNTIKIHHTLITLTNIVVNK